MTLPVDLDELANHFVDVDGGVYAGHIDEQVIAAIAELRASRKLVALGSTLAHRVMVRASIQGPSKVRLLYEEERAAEAFDAALMEADSIGD